MKSEDGEFDNVLHMPPRPIIKTDVGPGNNLSPNWPPDNCETEEDVPKEKPSTTIEEIQLSYTLRSKLESLKGSILVCEKKDCPTCGIRRERMEMVIEQIKAELTPLNDVRKDMARWQNENTILKTYIDTNHGPGTSNQILRQSQMRKV